MRFWQYQHHSELKSLWKSLSWINSQIYKGEESLDFDRECTQLQIKTLEQNIWSYDSTLFQEAWLFKEGKLNKQFLHLEDLRLAKKEISGLQLESGIVVTNSIKYLKQFISFIKICI